MSEYSADLMETDPTAYEAAFNTLCKHADALKDAARTTPHNAAQLYKKGMKAARAELVNRHGYPGKAAKLDAEMVLGMALAIEQGRGAEAASILIGAEVTQTEIWGGPNDGAMAFAFDSGQISADMRRSLEAVEHFAASRNK